MKKLLLFVSLVAFGLVSVVNARNAEGRVSANVNIDRITIAPSGKVEWTYTIRTNTERNVTVSFHFVVDCIDDGGRAHRRSFSQMAHVSGGRHRNESFGAAGIYGRNLRLQNVRVTKVEVH
jgi:hypothetical protein